MTFIGIFLFSSSGCDFQNVGGFKLPTWFFDLSFPLVQKKYSLEGLVDNKQIFPTEDSLGMQLVFEGVLPDTAINTDILEVELNQDISYNQDPVSSPIVSVVMDTTFTVSIPLAPGGQLVDNTGASFSVPPTSNKTITGASWNAIASAFDTTYSVTISLPDIPSSELPEFITAVDAYIIKPDGGGSTSDFTTTFKNNGLPTEVENIDFKLLTDIKTLASHTHSSLAKDETYGPEITSLSADSLKGKVKLTVGFDIASTNAATLTVNSGDSVQVNFSVQLRIAGVDSAVVQIAETSLPVELPTLSFPSDIEIYSGTLNPITGLDVNELVISNLKSTYPFDVSFTMSYANFKPPTGKDSVKIDTTLKNGVAAISKTFDVDGYSFYNPAGSDSALAEMTVNISAKMAAQISNIPLDGSDFGAISIRVQITKLSFASLEANIVQEFPPSQFNIAGMPLGFSGMSFSNVQMEIEMLNGIRLPVVLNFDMIATNQAGDSSIVAAKSTLGMPIASGDTTKTIMRLSRDGTTTLKYKAPTSVLYSDSTTVPPGFGESTIVDLMSFNPATIHINSKAKIDGRGTLEAGQSIGGKYRMIAPFEVIMDPMTFISVTNTPIQEMNHDTRNRIRSTFQSASLTGTVENKIPSGGEIAILLSNKAFFPLDTTVAALSAYRDSMVAKAGWNPTDSLYVISSCDSMNPSIGSVFIFDVMDDFEDCIDGLKYLVKGSVVGMDTVMSYVDTLLKIPLPDPGSFYTVTTATAHAGAVREPGSTSYTSAISPKRILLITDPGDHFTAPRFHLTGSEGKKVFLSRSDYIDINSTITFRLSSTGMTDSAPPDLVIKFPNGGETINKNETVTLKWKTYGMLSKVDIAYSAKTNPKVTEDEDWTTIQTEVANVDSFLWLPSSTSGINSMAESLRDSVRIRVKHTGSSVVDMSGWYFTISHASSKLQTLQPKFSLMEVKP